jgi:adenosylcobinamide-GDP ribazoletransferase
VVLTALRGGVGFLTRLPAGHDEAAWDGFRAAPATFPAVGYLVGAAVAGLLVLGRLADLPAVTLAVALLAGLYALTGINHLDGVADLGDAAVVHGDADRRVAALKDTTLGVGGAVALGVVLLATALGLLGVAGLPAAGVGVVVAAEVGAKAAMAGVACLGTARHEGLGSALTDASGPRALAGVTAVAAPAALLAWPRPTAALALVGAVAGGGLLAWWANGLLGGVNGDVFGAVNAVGRAVGLHVGVVAWTLS